MKKQMRPVLLLVAVLLVLTTLSACSDSEYEEMSEKEKLDITPIGTCAGHEVLYEELRYVTLTYRDLFEGRYGKGIWENPETAAQYRPELERTVWNVMLNNYTVLAACNYYMPGYDMDDKTIAAAVQKEVDAAIADFPDEESYRNALEQTHMSEHFLRFCLTVSQFENELRYVLSQDLGIICRNQEEFLHYLEEGNYVPVQHVLVRQDPGEDPAENRAKAERIQKGLADGSLTLEGVLNSAQNEDPTNTAPYCIVRGVYTEKMENAAFALTETGSVSDVIDVEGDYYILVRVEITHEALLLKLPSLFSSYQWAMVEDHTETFRSEISLELNDFGKSLDLLAIR